jgi:uncharacterized SAM-binding protein YcdF (DUF218 family)
MSAAICAIRNPSLLTPSSSAKRLALFSQEASSIMRSARSFGRAIKAMDDPAALISTGLALAALLLFSRWRRLGRLLVVAISCLSAAIAFTPISKWLLLPLEQLADRLDPATPVDGVIVLGGIGLTRGQIALYGSGMRPLGGLILASRGDERLLVFSGGATLEASAEESTEAAAARKLYASLGFPLDRLILEDKSRTTAENAAFTARLLSGRRGCWALVTSAAHMPRALAAFAAVDFAVKAFPVDYRTAGDSTDNVWFAGGAVFNFANMQVAMHEWMGLVWYRVSGRSRSFLPKAPSPADCRS